MSPALLSNRYHQGQPYVSLESLKTAVCNRFSDKAYPLVCGSQDNRKRKALGSTSIRRG